VLFKKLGVTGLLEMGVFLGVVGFGLVYIWRRGALEWD
jgi:NADH-quinone oxidoreductase subunit A